MFMYAHPSQLLENRADVNMAFVAVCLVHSACVLFGTCWHLVTALNNIWSGCNRLSMLDPWLLTRMLFALTHTGGHTIWTEIGCVTSLLMEVQLITNDQQKQPSLCCFWQSLIIKTLSVPFRLEVAVCSSVICQYRRQCHTSFALSVLRHPMVRVRIVFCSLTPSSDFGSISLTKTPYLFLAHNIGFWHRARLLLHKLGSQMRAK